MKIYLTDILLRKKARIIKRKFDTKELVQKISNINAVPSFYKAIEKDGLSIIGEVKKASPSKGLIKVDFNPLAIAKEYEDVVDAISVLTEEDYFLGKDDYLKEISQEIALPTLCKDFIIDPNQIFNAKALGASCVLLIVAILSDAQLQDYINIAHSLGMDVLVEVHTFEEINRALRTDAKIIGINNRDLETFRTDIEMTLELRQYIPEDKLVISESGIHTPEDVRRLKKANINGILIGESFMKAPNIKEHGEALRQAYN